MKIKGLTINLWKHLSKKRKKQLFALSLVMIISGFVESFSIASIIPFLIGMSNPNAIINNKQIVQINNFFNINSIVQFQIIVTIIFISTVVITATIKLINIWLNKRVAASIGSDLSCKVYLNTLQQPYEYHLNKNSSELITINFSQISNTVTAINASLQFLTSMVSAIFCIAALLVTNYLMALISGLLFSFCYLLIALTSKKQLTKNSLIISNSQKMQMKILQEGIGGIKDILLNSSQKTYLNMFRPVDFRIRRSQAQNILITTFPRYILEAAALILIASAALFVSLNSSNNSIIVPLLGGFALGSQRLLLSMQQCYSTWSVVKANKTPVNNVIEILNQDKSENILNKKNTSFQLNSYIQAENISFKYPSNKDFTLKNIDLRINCGDRIGIIGSTGSGKSTLIDILMGLLKPYSGRLLLDGKILDWGNNSTLLSAFKASVAHVPQNIFLADATFAENIAFGVEKSSIILNKVKDSAIKAKISDFIESTPHGYNSICGERGTRLSGGQRQRIAIARALYRDAKLIFFDEATSSLDNKTENEIVKGIESLSKKLTIVLVAHRISTIRNCDYILKLEKGRVVGFGSPQEILPKE